MTKRGFERLVRVRSIWERQAKANAAQAKSNADDARSVERAAAEAHSDALRSSSSLVTPEQLEMQRSGAMATHAQLTEAAAARANAAARSEAAQGSWRRAAQDHDVAEKLDQRRRQEAAYEARRVADRSLDEIAAIMHPRREERR